MACVRLSTSNEPRRASVRCRVERGNGVSSSRCTVDGANADALASVEDAQSLCNEIAVC